MLELTRQRIRAYLAAHETAVISAAGADGPEALPVRYQAEGLVLTCLLPCWADALYYLEIDARVTLVIPAAESEDGSWLRYTGMAAPILARDWATWLPGRPQLVAPGDLYKVVRVQPRQIDLFDERQGWGMRETVELIP
jgi:hypothetical protein